MLVSKEVTVIRKVNLLGENQIGEPNFRSLCCDKKLVYILVMCYSFKVHPHTWVHLRGTTLK